MILLAAIIFGIAVFLGLLGAIILSLIYWAAYGMAGLVDKMKRKR